ncbi:hypothetical protein FSP39_016363 [Pinctada imbricata]|uniref:DUF7043 domain-containing protein n=1 Tax=Pinctada imbricata TaxID=66713 RepID=A0AA88XNR9_PINIB|nr:hypothetical protein FSP39_016363 [Pinctada imbricata]
MRLNVLHQILGLFFLSTTHAADDLSECNFPSFLKENTLYRASYKNRDFMKAYFNKNQIDATLVFGDGEKPRVKYDKRCIEELERGKYLVEVIEKYDIHSKPEYTCMQFIRRSEFVVQIKESRIPLMYKSPSLCNELEMSLEMSPFFATPLRDHPKIKCPFTGGYNLKVVYKSKKLCMSEVVPPRMESECEDG